jgi:hypothetical protein
VAGPRFDEAAFGETLARIARGQDHGSVNQTPAFDPKLRREHLEAAISGRKIIDYRAALENTGFSFVPAKYLPRIDGRLQKDDLWRNTQLRLAFTEDEILGGFPGPEEFVTWIEECRLRRRAQMAGLLLSKSLPRRR